LFRKIQRWVNSQMTSSNNLQLVRDTPGDDVAPAVYRAPRVLKYLSYAALRAEVLNDISGEHGPQRYRKGNPVSIMVRQPRPTMVRMLETMGDRIKLLRIAQGLSQSTLGKQCGVSKAAVSKWENGGTSNIRLPTFMRLCESLHTDPAYLIWGAARIVAPGAASNSRK